MQIYSSGVTVVIVLWFFLFGVGLFWLFFFFFQVVYPRIFYVVCWPGQTKLNADLKFARPQILMHVFTSSVLLADGPRTVRYACQIVTI